MIGNVDPARIRGLSGRGTDEWSRSDEGRADGAGVVTRNVHRREGDVDERGNATRGDEE